MQLPSKTNIVTVVLLGLFLLVLYAASQQGNESSSGTTSDPVNLIRNASLEIASEDASLPLYWQQSGYGENERSFIYPVEGRSDGNAVRISIEGHKDGDAKWHFDDIPVTPGDSFSFSSYYKSTIDGRVVARFGKGDCIVSGTDCDYVELGALPKSDEWTEFGATFVVPEDTLSLTVLHLIEGEGFLDIDDLMLVEETPVRVTNGVPNSSLEAARVGDNSLPKGWETGGYGEHSAIFEYVKNDGKSGDRSVKVTVSGYVSGDAKWVYEAQPVLGGEDYLFRAWYRTNTVPHVVAQYMDLSGDISFFGLPRPEPRGEGWHEYEAEFSVPEHVVSATVFFFLEGNGWVQTDDYSIAPYSYVGFERPLVSLTFDDGVEENIETALPVMQTHGFLSTQCYMTETFTNDEKQIANVHLFKDADHEICSHTVSHPNLTTLGDAALTRELRDSREQLETIAGTAVPHFASPFGAYDTRVVEEIKKHYEAHRTVDEGYNSADNFDPYRLKVQNMLASTTLEEFKSWVTKAQEDNTWLILVYHKVDEKGIGPFDTHIDDFRQQMEFLADSDIVVERFDNAFSEAKRQATNEGKTEGFLGRLMQLLP